MIWRSYHVFPSGNVDALLTTAIAPFLLKESAAHALKRAFFVRYDERSHHIRLRLQYRSGFGSDPDVRARLVSTVRQVQPTATVKRIAYSRVRHYYGETRATLYAELANVVTSSIALEHLVRSQPKLLNHAPTRAVWAVCLAHALVSGVHEQPNVPHVLACLRFAEAAMRDIVGVAPSADLQELSPRILDSVLALSRAAEGTNVATPASTRLLSRLLALSPGGSERLAHALHLLVNQLGVPLPDEATAWRLLKCAVEASATHAMPVAPGVQQIGEPQ
jgi:thiopeptide-type bacteriocin biosynthesis protein